MSVNISLFIIDSSPNGIISPGSDVDVLLSALIDVLFSALIKFSSEICSLVLFFFSLISWQMPSVSSFS